MTKKSPKDESYIGTWMLEAAKTGGKDRQDAVDGFENMFWKQCFGNNPLKAMVRQLLIAMPFQQNSSDSRLRPRRCRPTSSQQPAAIADTFPRQVHRSAGGSSRPAIPLLALVQ